MAKNKLTARVRARVLQRSIHPPPSFNQMLESRRRVFRAAADIVSERVGQPVPYHNSIALPEVAAATGVPLPELYQGPCDLDDVDWGSLPDRFVFKPCWGSGSTGVRVFSRTPDGLHEGITDTSWTVDRVVAEHRRLAAAGKVSTDVKIEEKLGAGVRPPFDFKLFAFQGDVQLAMQVDRVNQPMTYRFYDGDWNPIRAPEVAHASNGRLPGPADPAALTAAAAAVSRAIDLLFARVDLYEHAGRVYLGEISPHPGTRMRGVWDRRLGEAWERAEARVLADRMAEQPR
jgi:hypothetical protein